MLLKVAVVLLLGGIQDPAPPAVALPTELVAYYRDYNFLNAFSSPFERQTLAAGWSEREETEPRLRAARDCMRRLSRRLLAIDAGFVRTGVTDSPFSHRAEMVEIRYRNVDEAKGTAVIELDVLTLVPQVNAHWIAQFDQQGRANEPPAIDDVLARASQPLRVGREIHHWLRVDGEWMREMPTLLFLAR